MTLCLQISACPSMPIETFHAFQSVAYVIDRCSDLIEILVGPWRSESNQSKP